MSGSLNASTNPSARPALDAALTPDPDADARRTFEALTHAAAADRLALARRPAATPDAELLGAPEFRARDRAPRIGARALEAALGGRKKGATAAPAAPAPAAGRRRRSNGGRAGRP